MAELHIFDNYCKIKNEPDIGFLWTLDNHLSFQVQGAEHTRAFKGYFNKAGEKVQWDGMRHLLAENLSFPIGLAQRVKDFFKNVEKPLTVIDHRTPKTPNAKIDILPICKSLDKEPRDYQLESVDICNQYDRGVLRICTGAGKTLISALITANFGKKTIVHVIGTDLLYQTHKFLSQVFNQKIGLIGDGNCDIQHFNVASVWTVGQALGLKKSEILLESDDEKSVSAQKYQDIQNLLKKTKVHIFDECHLAACATIQEIANNINPEHIYGMSASPWRDDNQDLLIECVLGKKIIDISASSLIDRGYLVQPIIKFIKVPKLEEKIPKNYQTIYKNYVTDNPVRNGLVIKAAEKLVEQGYQTLVLYNSVAHGKLLYQEISKKLPCALLSGKDSSEVRENVKKQLEEGKIKCVIASKIFDIGVDLPTLSGLIIASAGKSSVRALQRIGRVIRLSPGKKRAAVVDFLDQAHFLKKHSQERKKIYSTEERFEIIWPK